MGIYDKITNDGVTHSGGCSVGISTRDPRGIYVGQQDPAYLDTVAREYVTLGSATLAPTALTYYKEEDPIVHDLTDGAGHGLLLATDQLYLTISSFNFTNPNYVSCKILFRYKTVSLTEYIGIVQSQQQ
jgi:hypothetical protein